MTEIEAMQYLRTHDKWTMLYTSRISKRKWIRIIENMMCDYKICTIFGWLNGRWHHCNIINSRKTEEEMIEMMTVGNVHGTGTPIDLDKFITEHFAELL